MYCKALLSLSLAALLSACASSPPPQAPVYVEPAPIASDADLASQVLLSALSLDGTPYRYGGNTPEGGFDCSGLIGYVYRNTAGIQLPRSTRAMASMRAPNVGREALETGDLVFFATNGGRGVSHAGIYLGEGKFVHAPSTGGAVRQDSLATTYWNKTYVSAKRVLPPSPLARQP